MKKILFIKLFVVVFTLFGICGNVFAQDEAFSKEDMVVNLGVGLGSYIGWSGYSTKVPFISSSFEYGLFDLFKKRATIGVGGYLAYTSSKYKGVEDWSYSDLIVGGRASFHFQFVEKLDTYIGLLLGYDIVSYGHKDANLGGSRFISSEFLGARYYLAKNFSIFGELGYGISPLEIGISFKF